MGFLFGIFAIIIVFLIIELIAVGLSFLLGIYKIILKCLVIAKSGEDGWKGLIPFYGTYVYYHLGFNHKTAVILFVADTVLFVSLTIINFMFRVVYNFYENTVPTANSYTGSPSSLNSLLQSFSNSSGVETTLLIAATIIGLIAALVNLIYFVLKSIKNYAVSHAFGMETGFCIVSLFLPVITNSIIAFSSSAEYCDYAVFEWFPD